jgi:type I restriction enzyme S subunit
MLGNLPRHGWSARRLETVLKSHSPGDWGSDAGVAHCRVLRSTNLTNERKLDLSNIALRSLQHWEGGRNLRRGDILLERSGGGPDQPVGRIGVVEKDLAGHWHSNFLHLLRPDEELIDASYLAWVLFRIQSTGRIVRLEQQTTQMRNLNFRDYLTMPIPFPPRREQEAIARILDAVDTSISEVEGAIRQTEGLVLALTQNLFSRGTKGEQQRKTQLGWIPKSWEVRSVADVTTSLEYGLSASMHGQGEIPILRMGNLQSGRVLLDDLKYVTLSQTIRQRYLLQHGDVLFNRVNSQDLVGKVGIYRGTMPCVFASYLVRVHANAEEIDNWFLGHLLNSYPVQCRIKRFATPGVQQVNINASNLGRVLIPVPSGHHGLEEQREIANILEQSFNAVDRRRRILAQFGELKRSLSQDLLTGHVRVAQEVLA